MKLLPTFAAALVVIASPVYSQCPYVAPQTQIFFGQRPAMVPTGFLVVKVDPAGVDRTGRVKILEPDDGLRGLATIRVDGGEAAECGGWGRLDGPAYMIGFLSRGAVGEIYFKAIALPLKVPALGTATDDNSYIVDPEYSRLARQHPRPK
ncbi:MAG: hypothetical protein V4475_09925 [Pseudomonadota bacterium]